MGGISVGFLRWWRARDKRVRLAWAVIAAVCLGWPTTATLQALGLPVFEQAMLALSWIAPLLTAVDLLFTSQLHEKTDDQDPGHV